MQFAMRIPAFLLLFFLFCASCGSKREQAGTDVLVAIDGNYLYKEDLQAVLPAGLSQDDSLLFAENYIRNWVEDVLLYNKAKSNVPDDAEIDKLVENYRKSLIVHTYQQELINQRLSSKIPDQELSDFYEKNKNLFVLEHPLVKGLFIKVPLSAPRLNEVRKWYKTESQENVDKLYKYSLQHAVAYDYFYNKWTPLTNILPKIPLEVGDPEEYINRNRQLEVRDTAFYYFLNVTGYCKAGESAPYEYALPSVKDLYVNTKRVDFIRGVKNDLYQEAVRKNKITYNY